MSESCRAGTDWGGLNVAILVSSARRQKRKKVCRQLFCGLQRKYVTFRRVAAMDVIRATELQR